MPRIPRLPDILTTANLSCGVASILLASQGQLTSACWLIFAGALLDMLDGLAARATGGGTLLGAQLDSLADMVTFGVAPAMVVWFLAIMPFTAPMQFLSFLAPAFDGPMNVGGNIQDASTNFVLIGMAVLVLIVASGWRLAKFNVDTRQTHGFLGLATPSNGLFWASIPLAITTHGGLLDPMDGVLRMALLPILFSPLLLLVAVILGVLMLSELPLPGLKFAHYGQRGNEVVYALLILGSVLLILFGFLAVPMILLLYLTSPLWARLFPKTP